MTVVGIAKSGTLSPTSVISSAAYQTFFAAMCPGIATDRTRNHAISTCFSFFLASVIFDVKLYRQIWQKYFKLKKYDFINKITDIEQLLKHYRLSSKLATKKISDAEIDFYMRFKKYKTFFVKKFFILLDMMT